MDQKDNKNKELIERACERVIETISLNMHLYGVTPSIGRLYGTLFFKDQPMTLDDMKEELQMSKTSMSTSVRTLTDLNMVEKVWIKGERKDQYEAKKDWYQIFFDYFNHQWRKVIQVNLNAINQSLKELEDLASDPSHLSEREHEEVQTAIEKLLYTKEYYHWLGLLFDQFESKEIFNYIKKPNED
ncbi:DNA-binding transcriptional regulator GbsR (MarR family) [Pullulanibacillus pueri]|uniref:HTH-type transcriptional regulator n=1 Tax=Pullulanibacillus pueri TaxID=1437324 RepID=A0A8J2ZYV2_9BACL|nr:GbsR/MarR family transcriptional regulator [Pullulanibacillus pueri]MBM7683750.1 DNA-binding transcriptional regulator GbsR (MarR family) [Pullulanibacillus pueri]GGH87353.1 HTH-type transcriptional repressor GbsR [Pullulanibacillus pueri]